MEREKFEESWKNAFEKAEVNPSEKVWTNIELDLEKAKGGDLKKRLLFYQMLAAASVVFAMAIGGVGYYYSFHNSALESSLAVRTEVAPEEVAPESRVPRADKSDPPALSDASAAQTDVSSRERAGQDLSSEVDALEGTERNQSFTPADVRSGTASPARPGAVHVKNETDPGQIITTPADQQGYPELPLAISERELPALYTAKKVKLEFHEQKQEVDPVIAMMARLEQREREVQRDSRRKKEDEENLWTSVGFAAGSFNSIQASAPMPSQSQSLGYSSIAGSIVDQESKATGYSYSMGVNIGTRLSERWVLQGGVNYLTHSSEYTADNVMMDSRGPANYAMQRFLPSATNELVNADASELSSKIVYTAPYSVNNSMRYLSIPMQAGYLIVNKTFGVQLNAGVATDLFLQNTVEGEGDQLAKTTQPVGSDSPYRTVNLSGLFGTEFSYRFGPHYRVSLNPGLRYPFNTIYKSEIGVQSTPLTFDVGLRFRYIFH